MKKNMNVREAIGSNVKQQTVNSAGSQTKDYTHVIFTALYLLVHFVSDFGGADVMGAQWLFTGTLDLIVLGYIIKNAKQYKEAIENVFQQRFTLLYTFFVLWALGSYFYAINPTESLVCLGRLASTFIIFINLSILFYKKNYEWIFQIVAYLVTAILIYDSIFVLSHFSQNLEEMNLDQNILSLMGNHGNKNVMAASLVIKIPFCLYVVLNSKLGGKVIGVLGLLLAFNSLFVLNTRSTFVAIILIGLLFIVFTIFTLGKDQINKIIVRIAFFIIPLVVSYFTANMILNNALSMQEAAGGYGTVDARLKTISLEKNSDRTHLWGSAFDYFKKHPIIGGGYGNWKLASIPYEKERANELFVPYHSHNDFIENAADLGLFGGLAYLGLFAFLFIFTIQAFIKPSFQKYRELIGFAFLGITCYFVDAFLNFPAERPAMQTMFTVCSALVLAPYFLVQETEDIKKKITSLIPSLYFILSLLLIVPSIYIANQVYASFKIQKYVMGEINANPVYATDSVTLLPNIPNLSTSALPVKALIARYYIRDKNFPAAIKLLKESYKDNPFIHYNDFLLTSVYASLNNYDSTLYYAKLAYYNWPRATSYYKNMMFAAVRKKDSIELNKAFDTSVTYSNTALTYEEYVKASFELKSKTLAQLNALLDTAAKKFPKEDFKNTRSLINSNGLVAPTTNQFAVLGLQNFQKGKFLEAAENYKQAIQLEPNNYTHFENAGICLYSAKKFTDCIYYFEKAAGFKENNTGKSQFYKGLSLINTGKKDQACAALNAAKAKGYTEADKFIKSNCQ
jgi:O-antigen ligase